MREKRCNLCLLQNLKDYYASSEESFNMKLINTVTGGGMVTTILNSLIAVTCYSSKIIIGINLLLTVFTVAIFIYTNKVKDYKKSAIITCIVVGIICFPALFLVSSGISSSIPMYFAFGVILTFMLLDGKALIAMVIGEIMVCICSYVVKFQMSATPQNYDRLRENTRDNLLGVIIVSLIVGVIFYVQTKIYGSQQEENERQKVMLEQSVYNIRRVQQEAEEAKREAENANRAKSEFLASISHEIRTPMNAIIGMSELIVRDEVSEETFQKAESIQRAAATLLAIINDILDVSKIESGKMEIRNSTYFPRELFLDVLDMVRFKLDTKPIELEVKLVKAFPCELYGDEVRIRQILTNILMNAVKYTNEGTITITADWKQQGDDAAISISVKDTGIGIKEEDMKKLFHTFERLEEKRNHGIEGSGLGLSICKQLLDLMGGKIKVKSTYGAGSEFTVSLVQKIINIEPVECVPRYKEVRQEQSQFTAPEVKVLIVDDNEVNLEVAQGIMKRYQFQIETAKSGRECLRILEEKQFDIIFMDHMMPEMDGIETVRIIRQESRFGSMNTPIIALTANALSGSREMFISEGFTEYISKPIELAKLHKLLLQYLPEQLLNKVEYRKEASEQILISGLDTGPVLENLGGNQSVYLSLLKTYIREVRKIAGQLNEKLEQDIEKFTIYIHSIKGSSANIGAIETFDYAKRLETAAKLKDRTYLEEKLPIFIEHLKQITANIENYLEACQPGCEFNGSRRDEKSELTQRELSLLQKGFDEMDINKVEECLERIKKYEYTPEINEMLDRLETYIENLEYTEGSQCVAEYMALMT